MGSNDDKREMKSFNAINPEEANKLKYKEEIRSHNNKTGANVQRSPNPSSNQSDGIPTNEADLLANSKTSDKDKKNLKSNKK